MRIAVLADIHGNGIALEYVLKDCIKQNIEKYVVLGDIVINGPMPSEAFEMIKSLNPIGWIKGNTDIWFEEITEDWKPSSDYEKMLYLKFKYAKNYLNKEKISFMKDLPFQFSFTVNGIDVLCVHGTPKTINKPMDGTVPPEEVRQAIEGVRESIILCGHTHNPFIGQIDDKKIFNVGGVGISFDGDTKASYGILDFSENGVELINRRIEYPIYEILKIAEERNFPDLETYRNTILKATRQ